MSQTNQPTSSHTSLKPYPVEETENGYEFVTANNSLYEIYIGEGAEYFSGTPLAQQSVLFGISRKRKPPKGTGLKDERIRDTVRWAIMELLDEAPDLIIAFNYSSHIRSPAARKELFGGWYEESDSQYLFEDYELKSRNGIMIPVGIIMRVDNSARAMVPGSIRAFEATKS